MKKTGVLNHRLSNVIASMGHTDMLVVADAGLPVPLNVERIDLAVTRGIPAFLDVVRAIAQELEVEKIYLAQELFDRDEEIVSALRAIFPMATVTSTPHEVFKDLTREARAVVRTGEFRPYANVILVSGVVF